MLRTKDLYAESRILKNFQDWVAERETNQGTRKDDIGKMLLTTSDATDG